MIELQAAIEAFNSLPEETRKQIKMWAKFTFHSANMIRLQIQSQKKPVNSRSAASTAKSLTDSGAELFRYYVNEAKKSERKKRELRQL